MVYSTWHTVCLYSQLSGMIGSGLHLEFCFELAALEIVLALETNANA